MRTVYLGTSEFAAGVLRRLTASPHAPVLVVTRPDRPRGRGRRLSAPPVAIAARELGLDLVQPERLHDPDVLERIAAASPQALCVCAYGVLIKEPLLSDHEILNVHPSLLPRWRGAAPVERAIMAGDAETGISIMRLTAGLDSGPVCLQERVPILPDDDYGSLASRLETLGGELLVRALDERPPYREQPEEGVTYAHKIEARDRALDHTRRPETVERAVRALRPHIGTRLPLPDGTFLGVSAARLGGHPVAVAGGRVHVEEGRLYLDCRGGTIELLEVQPPGGRRMPAAEWLRGRPDPDLIDFWLDPRLPDRPLQELVERAVEYWTREDDWEPNIAALCWRGDAETLAAVRQLATSPEPVRRAVGAYVAGQLGCPERTMGNESLALLDGLAGEEEDPEVLVAVALGLGNLGADRGTERLLDLARHPEPVVREAAACSLCGRDDDQALAALLELSRDPDPDVRDWATFGLGALADRDSPELRHALADRLDDDESEARLEAIYGLALRRDPRGLEALLALTATAPDLQATWSVHLVQESAVRLAELTGDPRLRDLLPEPEAVEGTVLERPLARALARMGASGPPSAA